MTILVRRWLMASAFFVVAGISSAAQAAVITGTVNDASGVRALGGAQVTIQELGRTEDTQANGAFRFSNVPAGTYTLVTSFAGNPADQQQITVGEDEVARLAITLATVEEILVIGQKAQLAGSIARQRSSNIVQSVLTRDAIGQFPDQNVAESVRRLTGTTVLNDQGEGRFISVRGLDPTLNAASINGTRILAPEDDTRAVALDVIPSEVVESIEVKKTLTPDMDADTIGASININTTSAFDREEPFVSITGEGSYNELNDDGSWKTGIDFSYPFSDTFGVAGGLSYNKRNFATDNFEADGWDTSDGGVVFSEDLEYRDYDVTRERLGATLSLDLKASDTTNLFARGLYSTFDDTEKRAALIFAFDEAPSMGDANSATFLSDDGEIEVERELKDRFETQKIQTYELGGETDTGAWELDYKIAYTKSRERETDTEDPTLFVRGFEDPGELGITIDYSDIQLISYEVFQGGDLFFDPAEYEFDTLEEVDGRTSDEEWSFQFDVARNFALDMGEFQLKAGGKVRLREKMFDVQLDVYDGFDGDYTLADVPGMQTYTLLNIEPIHDLDAVRMFNAENEGLFELNQIDTDFESNIEDYEFKEDIYAAYLMGTLETDRTTIIAGVRMEHTENEGTGNVTELIEEGATFQGMPVDEDFILVTPTTFENDYTDWLPSVNFRYNAADDVVLRAGVFKSVVRPNFGAVAPRFIVEENDEDEREGEFGNPDLDPIRAWNVDLSAEWYFAPNAVIQIGGFYKSVKNFLVFAEFDGGDAPFNGVFNGVEFTEAVIPLNGETADVLGLEFNYQQAMTFLPEPWDGLLFGLNYTYTDSEGEIMGRKIPLPQSSEHTFNGTIGYEKGPISIRFTASYRSSYLDELGDDPEEDRWVKDHLQFDAQIKYRVTDNFRVYLEFVNINDEPFLAFQKGPNGDRPLQFETYSWTGKAGVIATF